MPEPAAFDAFVAPARRRPQVWRLCLGCVLMAAVALLWVAATFGGIVLAAGPDRAAALLRGMLSPETPTGTLLLLSTFLGMALAPVLAARLLHGRGPATLFGPAARTVRHFGVAVGVVAVVYGLSTLLWSAGFDPERGLGLDLWLRLLPLSLLLVLIQTGAEEMIFRGYLMQQVAARLPWRLAYLGLPAMLFAALHFDPATMGPTAWLVVCSAFLFGLAAADLTQVTGSLGAAWGLHFANNALAILLVATQGSITGLALYVTPYRADEADVTAPLILVDLLTLALVWALLRWRLGRSLHHLRPGRIPPQSERDER